jgi:hypothetical protein
LLIGLGLYREEHDIAEEWLAHVSSFCERIYILDGSEDKTILPSIAKDFNKVVCIRNDDEFTNQPIVCGGRKFVHDIIKADEKARDLPWVVLLHADEFWHSNPIDLARNCPQGYEIINVRNVTFFPHTSQKDSWTFGKGDSIVDKCRYYMHPGHDENRMFRNHNWAEYQERQYMHTVPANIPMAVWHSGGVIKQYPLRTVEQGVKRAFGNLERGWQINDYINVLETKDIFFDTLSSPIEWADRYHQYHNTWYNWPNTSVKNVDIDGLV